MLRVVTNESNGCKKKKQKCEGQRTQIQEVEGLTHFVAGGHLFVAVHGTDRLDRVLFRSILSFLKKQKNYNPTIL